MLYIVVPVRDEADHIGPLLEKIGPALGPYHAPYRVMVVDGDSGDGTPKVARRHIHRIPVDVLELREDCGLGGALQAGLAAAVPDADTIVTLYGDGSHDPANIFPMLGRIAEGYDVVIASRFAPAGRPGLGARVAARILRRLFPMGAVTDYTGGLRAYSVRALRRVIRRYGRLVSERGRACNLELLLRLRAAGARAAEVPMSPIDAPRPRRRLELGRHLAVVRRHLRD
jgi:dolichol-phosphate mannosyltransferase